MSVLDLQGMQVPADTRHSKGWSAASKACTATASSNGDGGNASATAVQSSICLGPINVLS